MRDFYKGPSEIWVQKRMPAFVQPLCLTPSVKCTKTLLPVWASGLFADEGIEMRFVAARFSGLPLSYYSFACMDVSELPHFPKTAVPGTSGSSARGPRRNNNHRWGRVPK